MCVAVTFLLLAAVAQDVPPTMPPVTGDSFAHYGQPQPVELSDLILGSYQRRAVKARGDISPLDQAGQFYMLNDRTASVVLMMVGELQGSLHELLGKRVEVVGVARELFPSQGKCPGPNGRQVPQSYCDDPQLPTTPDLAGDKVGWPKWSITAWAVHDVTEVAGKRPDLERASLADLLASAELPPKDVKVAGRFCGASLCGSLGAPPEPSAWAVDDDGTAVWIVGKEPRGKGWSLDPMLRADTTRWIEVIGRLQPCRPGAATRCLRARSVTLIPRPNPPPPP